MKRPHKRTWVWRLRTQPEKKKTQQAERRKKIYFVTKQIRDAHATRWTEREEKKSTKIKIKTKIHISSGVVRRISIFFFFFFSFGALLKEFLLKIKPNERRTKKKQKKKQKKPILSKIKKTKRKKLELHKSDEMVHTICDDGVIL